MSYAENILFRTTPQVNQTDDLAKALGVTPQQGTAPIGLPEARQLEVKENGDPLELYFNGFDEGRTGEPLAEAAGQSGAQGAALDAAGLRQDADVGAVLSGQRTGELVEGAGNSLLPKTTAESVSAKLDTYLLEPTHPVGGSKAKWFKEALGFTKDNSADLAKQIVFNSEKAIQTTKNAYGTKFSQVISVQGANGKIIDVEFIFIKNNDGVIRLVTSIPAKR